MNERWVRIRSWHIPAGWVSRGGLIRTLCGKWAPKDAETFPELPVNQKSCEKCMQLAEYDG